MTSHQTHKNWENSSLENMPHSGRPSSSVTCQQVKSGALIRIDKRLTIDELASQFGVSLGSTDNIIESLR